MAFPRFNGSQMVPYIPVPYIPVPQPSPWSLPMTPAQFQIQMGMMAAAAAQQRYNAAVMHSMPFPTPGVPFPIPGVPFPALGVPFPTLGVPFSAPGVSFPTPGVPFPTPGIPSPMPGVSLRTPHPGSYQGAYHRWGQRKTRAPTKKPLKHASQSMTTRSNHAIPRHYQRGKKNARQDLVEPPSGMSATARQGHKSKKQKEKRNHRIADNIAHYVVANDGKGPQLALSYI